MEDNSSQRIWSIQGKKNSDKMFKIKKNIYSHPNPSSDSGISSLQ